VTLDLRKLDRNDQNATNDINGMTVLGCKEFLLVVRRAHFIVYVPDAKEVLQLVQVTKIEEKDLQFTSSDKGLTWVCPEFATNAFGVSTHPGRLCVWQAQTGGSLRIFSTPTQFREKIKLPYKFSFRIILH
jgi:hypothetical protein